MLKKYLEDKEAKNGNNKNQADKKQNRCTPRSEAYVESLGLHKISQVVEREDTPVLRGMIRKVHHLVTVIE